MPTIIRKTVSSVQGRHVHSVSWQVSSSIWSPPTDAYETEQACVVRVELAGMRDEDFEVAVEKNILRVSGSRPDLPERRAYHQMEIRFGKFATSVAIPAAVDVDNATAEYKDGFLTVVLPKIKSDRTEVH